MSTVYSDDKKKKLADKIHALPAKNKENLKKIKRIIFDNNPSLEFTKNKNGMFTDFLTLENNTYVELDKFITKLENARLRRLEEEVTNTDDLIATSENIFSDDVPIKNSKKLRMTNTEIQLLNRARYEKALEKNARDESDSSDDNSENEVDANKDVKNNKNNKNDKSCTKTITNVQSSLQSVMCKKTSKTKK
jgi:hypothetical protein